MSAFHVYYGPDVLEAPPVVRKMHPSDAFAALAEGFDDFRAMPSHLAFLAIFYVGAGIALTAMSSFSHMLELVFPLAAGFALVGPLLALGLYELSRRRELGMKATFADAFVVAHSPALPSLLCLGLVLIGIFAAWIASAEAIYASLYGSEAPASALGFLSDVVSTERGWRLIGLGFGVGFVFAALTLSITVVSFPLMLDRNVGLVPAIATSLRVTAENPLTVASWGLIVAALLVLGALPLFIGLAVVMPVLGHASWRFYRRAVRRDPQHEHPAEWPKVKARPASYYANPHSVLFPPPLKSEE